MNPKQRDAYGCTKWIKLQADDFEAVIPSQSILAYTGSFIAELARLALANAEGSSTVAPIRLDCSAEVLKEVVQYIRESNSLYEFPADARLCFRVRRQLNYLGLNQWSSAQDTLLFLDPTCGSDTGLPKLFKYQLNPSATALTTSSALVGPARQHTATVCPYAYADQRSPCGLHWMMTDTEESSGMCVFTTMPFLAVPAVFSTVHRFTETTIRAPGCGHPAQRWSSQLFGCLCRQLLNLMPWHVILSECIPNTTHTCFTSLISFVRA